MVIIDFQEMLSLDPNFFKETDERKQSISTVNIIHLIAYSGIQTQQLHFKSNSKHEIGQNVSQGSLGDGQ